MAIEMRAIFRANTTPEIIKHENITHVLEEHSPIRTLELLSHATPCHQQISVQTDKCSVYSLLQIDNISVRSTPFYDSGYITFGLSNNTNFDSLIPIKEILTHEQYNANKYEVGK
jgi:hypothetical protein